MLKYLKYILVMMMVFMIQMNVIYAEAAGWAPGTPEYEQNQNNNSTTNTPAIYCYYKGPNIKLMVQIESNGGQKVTFIYEDKKMPNPKIFNLKGDANGFVEYSDYKNCPANMYLVKESWPGSSPDKTNYTYKHYAVQNQTDGNNAISKLKDNQKVIISEQTTRDEYYGNAIDNSKFDNCEDLLGAKFMKLINEYYSIVYIAVPILILVLGILDFGSAVLASSEENMKKSSQKFIKRLLIGVAVFLIPTILNLVFYAANQAKDGNGANYFNYINGEICVE